MDPLHIQPHQEGQTKPKLTVVSHEVESVPSSREGHGKAVLCAVFGALGLVSWLVPWVGFPLGLYGFVEGIKARHLRPKSSRLATIGTSLCALSMALSVANLMVAIYTGSSGGKVFSGLLFR